MLAATAVRCDPQRPLACLRIGPHAMPEAPDSSWAMVRVHAVGLNHHDLWALRGVGVRPGRLPIILGAEAAGVDERGNEVIIYPLIGDPAAGRGDETLDPQWRMLSTDLDGTLAEWVTVPRANLLRKPAELTFSEAACLPGAWLTAYRMLFERSGAPPGATILVQGAGGGVATALVVLGTAAGYRMWITSRCPRKRQRARQIGADLAVEPGARLPGQVDAVMETVGQATWEHSLRAVRPGGRVVVCGATTGAFPEIDLARVFYRQLSIVGSTLGTRDQLARLIRLCVRNDIRPVIDRSIPLADAGDGFAAMASGRLFGKVVCIA